jgi:hypothetical protein
VRRILPLALFLLVAGCHGGASNPPATSTSFAPITTTPTTDPGEACRQLTDDTYDLLAGVAAELAEITPQQLEDPDQWPQAMLDLEAQGRDLDRRAADLGCDPGAVQQDVLVRASALEATGLGRLLLDLLLGRRG